VERGPLVLALDKGVNFELPDIGKVALKPSPSQTKERRAGTKAPAAGRSNVAPLTQERPGLYSLAGVVVDGAQQRDLMLHLVPFAAAKEYRVWLPRVKAGQ
jgi:hypothetical protein